ncbi:MAG: CoA-binding protein [Rhodospirillales bacterium]
MTVANLEYLFRPRSIALFASDREARTIGGMMAKNLFLGGFDGPVMPVHPTEAAVHGVLAYPSVDKLPMPANLAVIALPPLQIAPLIAELGPCAAPAPPSSSRRISMPSEPRKERRCGRRCWRRPSRTRCASSVPPASA